MCSYELILFKNKLGENTFVFRKKKIDSYKFLHKWKLKINQHFKLKKKKKEDVEANFGHKSSGMHLGLNNFGVVIYHDEPSTILNFLC